MKTYLLRDPKTVESQKPLAPFGTIKRWFGYTHFLLKGLEKVRCEWSLMTLAYNLKRVLNILGVEALIRAMKAMPTAG